MGLRRSTGLNLEKGTFTPIKVRGKSALNRVELGRAPIKLGRPFLVTGKLSQEPRVKFKQNIV